MATPVLSVREIQQSDIPLIIDYWLSADHDFLVGMGVDVSKLPSREQWLAMLPQQLEQPYEEKQSYCMIWLADGQPVGHSNVNKIVFGEEAYMHLHLWKPDVRQKGMGVELVKMTLPWFFKNLKLKILFCEPYALNPAPNKTLEKVGFAFEKEYLTVPGSFSFEQPTNRWVMSAERSELLM